MAEVLGAGCTHIPSLTVGDEFMATMCKWALANPELPAELRDPANWPERMRAEWSDDQGLAAAAAHRKALREQFDRVRESLDEFQPDLVLIWGDDQYELFHEDVIPPFAVCAFADMTTRLWSRPMYQVMANYWNEDKDTPYDIRGHREAGKYLTTQLLNEGVDVAYSYEPPAGRPLPAAFVNTIRYLDWDGRGFPYPTVFVSVNCYGRRVVTHKGGVAYPHEFPKDPAEFDPPSPSPARCFDVGAAIGRALAASPWRVAVVASSSWSHAFLVEKTQFLWPDTESDRTLYELLIGDKLGSWRDSSLADVESAGQHEMLNWFCLAGAVEELGLKRRWSELIESDVFTSNKVFAVFENPEDN
jgi:Catalytic LigB subunit of aromatic ring-opening dioxygenase